MYIIFSNCARALARTLILRLRPLVELLLLFIRYVVVTTGGKIDGVYACAFQSCFFELVFVSFFLDSKQIYIYIILFHARQSN